jgi:hypothetical protein
VSCDNKFVRRTHVDFFEGKFDSSANTDTNHNMKNLHHQMIIRGNSFATVGIYGKDAGLLVTAGIAEELWNIKDFASDLLVIRLASAQTATKILKLTNQDIATQLVLTVSLLFMRAHLYAVNYKGNS